MCDRQHAKITIILHLHLLSLVMWPLHEKITVNREMLWNRAPLSLIFTSEAWFFFFHSVNVSPSGFLKWGTSFLSKSVFLPVGPTNSSFERWLLWSQKNKIALWASSVQQVLFVCAFKAKKTFTVLTKCFRNMQGQLCVLQVNMQWSLWDSHQGHNIYLHVHGSSEIWVLQSYQNR